MRIVFCRNFPLLCGVKRLLLIATLLLLTRSPLLGRTEQRLLPLPADTTILAEEVVIVGQSLKQGRPLAQSPVSATLFTHREAERWHLEAPKQISSLVPNLYAPDYGSRMTSSIYVRGFGSRIDQPVVGLNVDNVPILNKEAYDLEVSDIERMEVLRGPQSTLYGRNTMGGVINILTRSPLREEGADLTAEYASGNRYKVRASSRFRLLPNLGMSVTGLYTFREGLFRNTYTGELCDREQSGGGRMKLEWEQERWFLGNTLSFSVLEQGGYPYHAWEDHSIAYNDPCGYERTTVHDALTLRHTAPNLTVESITSYQYLDDEMLLDQDFRPESYFTLQQKRSEHALTEEVLLRGARKRPYQWLVGLFGFYKRSEMQAPVTFKADGIENLILGNIPEGIVATFPEEFLLNSDFLTRTWGVSLYHESSWEVGRWLLTAGLRLDGEWARMPYHSYTEQACKVQLTTIEPFALKGSLDHQALEWLPKLSVRYSLGANRLSTLYASVAKGFKAGGFNTQMFSEVLQQALMERMGVVMNRHFDIREVVQYDPEWSWNYEVGGHIHAAQGDFVADWSLFWIDCHDQQLTVFPPGQTTGRMMTNAGRTRSYGAEFSASIRPTRHLRLDLAYGYTHATFLRYQNGPEDYRGNRVPYAPEHTLSARIDYTFTIPTRWLERIIPSLNLQGAGPIAWNEQNDRWQPLYLLTGASLRFEQKHYTLECFCQNLFDVRYDVFYFKSVSREFAQQGLPRNWGIRLGVNF